MFYAQRRKDICYREGVLRWLVAEITSGFIHQFVEQSGRTRRL
jgi:hypothetical protein